MSGGGGSSTPANTTQSGVTTTKPWGAAMPYLKGDGDTTGIFPSAENFFNQYSTLSPEQSGLNADHSQTLGQRSSDPFTGVGNDFLGGQYNSSGQVDLNAARAGQGALDPSQAYQSMLTGQINNPYMQSLHQGSINTSLRGYDDALQQVQQQILPQIEQDAFASGMYGGSRQGIAEGMVGQQLADNARDLGIAGMDYGNQLYGGAYQNAQQLMAGAAGDINSQAGQNAQYNTGLDLQQNAQNAGMAQTGLNTMLQGYGLDDNTYNQLQSILAAPQNQYQNALNQYASILSPGAGLGGSSSSSTSVPIYSSNGAQIIGGGMAGLGGLLSMMGSGT
jgi:hypothetical protein